MIIDGELKQFACAADVTDYTIPEDVTSIGYAAFENCSSLKSINLPNSIVSIGKAAFDKCSSLTSITIPESVNSIGDGVFTDCKNLMTVYCKPTTPPDLSSENPNLFWPYADIDMENRVIYVPIKSLADYKAADGWKEYAEYIIGYNF